MRDIRIYADTVVVDGVEYPRCVRALGIARCGGAVLDGGNECSGCKR